ncbi:MAG: hypothetical protein E7231_10970 [Cellulosilyticum sp.]|nr:hypothetical protein [Cellulosilyticum sp.]
MYNSLDYKIVAQTFQGQPTLQTFGLQRILDVELCMQLVLSPALTRGIIAQVAEYLQNLIDAPSLFNDCWITYTFQENTTLCVIPFVLLESPHLCHIIVPDTNGHYPWQSTCQALFSAQADDTLLLSNMLTAIKSCFLEYLIVDIALEVYPKIGITIDLNLTKHPEQLSEYLADKNLDLFIVLILCLNQSMVQINEFILKACRSIPLVLTNMSDPLLKAREITSNIYTSSMKEDYIGKIMVAFYKLNNR